MKPTVKNICTILLVAFMLIASISVNPFASKNIIEYEETHDQINFDNLCVCVVNKNKLIVDIDITESWIKKRDAKQQKEKYEAYVTEHPEAVNQLINAVNSSEYVCAISYTDAPVIYVGDHYERLVKKDASGDSLFGINASADNLEISDDSTSYRFSLQTMVSRSGSSNPYTYTAVTFGGWENSTSLLGGEEKPAAGGDYVLQACPTVTSSDEFSSLYNYSTSGSIEGQEGTNYFRREGGDSWIKFEVIDDPIGIAQLKAFSCTQTFIATSTATTKKINSYYVHTWKSMSLTATISGTAGAAGGIPSAGVGLSLTPGIQDKQWQLYNYVSYNW